MRNLLIIVFCLFVNTIPVHAQEVRQDVLLKEINSFRTELTLMKKDLDTAVQRLEEKRLGDRELVNSKLGGINDKIEIGFNTMRELVVNSLSLLEKNAQTNQTSMQSLSRLIWIITGFLSIVAVVLGFFGYREWKDIRLIRAQAKEAQATHYYLEARTLALVEKEYMRAIDKLERALEINPKSDTSWMFKGYCQKRLENFSGAEQSIRKAIEIDPNVDYYHYNLACYCALRNKFEEAVISLKKAIEINPINETDAKKDSDFNTMRLDANVRQQTEIIGLIGSEEVELPPKLENRLDSLERRFNEHLNDEGTA